MRVRPVTLLAAVGAAISMIMMAAAGDSAIAAQAAVVSAGALADRSDVIIHCAILKITPADGGILLGTALRGDLGPAILKGAPDIAFWDVFVPAASAATFARGDDCILFTRAEPAKQRLVLLPDPGAKTAATAETYAQIGKASQAEKPLRVFVGTSETTYRMGQPVILVWRLRNISSHPIQVYNGLSAFGWDASGTNEEGRPAVNLYLPGGGTYGTYNHSGFRFGKEGEGEFQRSAADYRRLAPGEIVEKRETLDALVPPGMLNIRIRYTCEDNRLGTKSKTTGIVENVPFVSEETALQVPIQPPDSAFLQEAAQKLKSVDPEQQRSLLFALSTDTRGAAIPQVRSLAHHPWWEIRRLVAIALTGAGQTMTPELRDLLHDPNLKVRTEAIERCGSQRIGGCGLPVLALMLVEMEAADKGFIPKPQAYIWEEQALFRGGDQRIGDLLCSRVEAGKDDGYILALLLGIQSQVNRRGGKVSPDEQTLVVKTWKERRAAVQGLWTDTDLKAEMDRCRTKIFNNFQLDPRLPAIQDTMNKLRDYYQHKPEDVTSLTALGRGIVPTTLFVLQNSWQGMEVAPLYKLYQDWKAVEMEDYLLGASCDGSLTAPATALAVDRDRAYPMIAALLPHSLGAAIALASLGEKRAVPFIMSRFTDSEPGWNDSAMAALTAATGQTHTYAEWQKWWHDTGSKQVWK